MKNYFTTPIPSAFALLLAAALFACPTDTDDNNNNPSGNENPPPPPAKTGKVTFFNESSYAVLVHQDAFSGPVLLELSAGQSKSADVRVSDNYGVGSTFPVEYLYRVNDAFDTESGDITASGIDPNVQINFVIEEDKSYTKRIPQPHGLEFQTAFLKISNSSNLQFELRYLGTAFKQAGNGNIPVAPAKTGVYKIESIPAAGKLITNYKCVSTFQETVIQDFTAQKGYIYNFTYNGSSVIQNREAQTIIFR